VRGATVTTFDQFSFGNRLPRTKRGQWPKIDAFPEYDRSS
jgi:hypothetical protein